MHGQAVIAGTRVPVSVVLNCLGAGLTVEEIVAGSVSTGWDSTGRVARNRGRFVRRLTIKAGVSERVKEATSGGVAREPRLDLRRAYPHLRTDHG